MPIGSDTPIHGDWWCPQCKEALPGHKVTYAERCVECGTPVEVAGVGEVARLEADLARLTEENEALRKDAERFRFLKRVYFDIKMSAFQLIGPTSTPEELDATIDAAIKEGS